MAGKYKKINKSGGLTIPAELRRDLDYFPGEAVEIIPQGGALILKKYTPKCFFCGSAEGIKKYKSRDVCQGCIKGLAREGGLIE